MSRNQTSVVFAPAKMPWYGDLTPAAVREARRGMLDWIGCALAGSAHPPIGKVLVVPKAIGSKQQATVTGHDLKLGLLDAALANGQMGHVLDLDDTHIGVVARAANGCSRSDCVDVHCCGAGPALIDSGEQMFGRVRLPMD